MSQKTLYEILGVNRSATAAEIKDAYRVMAMKWHPDRNPNNRIDAEEKFKAIGAAYKVLSDPEKRQEYDKWLADQLNKSSRQTYSSAEISEDDAEQMFFESMLDLAIALAHHGYDAAAIAKALIALDCPQSIAKSVAAMAVRFSTVSNPDSNAINDSPTSIGSDIFNLGMLSKGIWFAALCSLVALADVPYGYYKFLHFVFFLLTLYGSYLVGRRSPGTTFVLLVFAVIYNPVISFAFGEGSKGIWVFLNVITIFALLYGYRSLKPKKLRSQDQRPEQEFQAGIASQMEGYIQRLEYLESLHYPQNPAIGAFKIGLSIFLVHVIVTFVVALEQTFLKAFLMSFLVSIPCGGLIGAIFYRTSQESLRRAEVSKIREKLSSLENLGASNTKVTLQYMLITLVAVPVILWQLEGMVPQAWRWPSENIIFVGAVIGLGLSLISLLCAYGYKTYLRYSNAEYSVVRQALSNGYQVCAIALGVLLALGYYQLKSEREESYKARVAFENQRNAEAAVRQKAIIDKQLEDRRIASMKEAEARKLDLLIASLEARYPELNEKSPYYSQQVVDEVLRRQGSYVQQGHSPSNALQMAVDDMTRSVSASRPKVNITVHK